MTLIFNKIPELKENKINDDVLTQINNLSEENQELKVKLNSLLSTFNNIDIVNQLPLQDQQSSIPVKNLVNLIRLKLNNGTIFIKEVELLQDLQLNVEQLSNVEKLFILEFGERTKTTKECRPIRASGHMCQALPLVHHLYFEPFIYL